MSAFDFGDTLVIESMRITPGEPATADFNMPVFFRAARDTSERKHLKGSIKSRLRGNSYERASKTVKAMFRI